MSKMFHSKNSLIQQRMQSVWDQSREVAAVSYVIARGQRNLSADQAMLAGLLHAIGVLPLCLYLDQNKINVDDETLSQLIKKCRAIIGAHLLRKWNFAQEIVTAVAEFENIHRESGNGPLVDYADIITIANLQDRARAKLVVWRNIAAVQRLGWTEEQCQNFLEDHAEEIEKVATMLGMSPQAKSPR
jgi:HD-like signal output (HDOD) protein